MDHTPRTMSHVMGKEGTEQTGRPRRTVRFAISEMEFGKIGDATVKKTPPTEYHTPHKVLYEQKDDETDPNIIHWHALEYDTDDKDSAMTVSCVRQTHVKPNDIQDLQLMNAPSENLELGRDKAMLRATIGEPGRSMNESSDTHDQMNAQMAEMTAKIKKLTAATTSLIQASANSDKQIQDLELRYGTIIGLNS